MFHAYQKELSFFSGGPRARVNDVKIKDNILLGLKTLEL